MVGRYKTCIFVSIVAGVVGGLLSSLVFVEKPVMADMRFPSVSTAEEFRLVDAQ